MLFGAGGVVGDAVLRGEGGVAFVRGVEGATLAVRAALSAAVAAAAVIVAAGGSTAAVLACAPITALLTASLCAVGADAGCALSKRRVLGCAVGTAAVELWAGPRVSSTTARRIVITTAMDVAIHTARGARFSGELIGRSDMRPRASGAVVAGP